MDLTINALECRIKKESNRYSGNISIEMEEIDENSLNTKEVAKCIDIETYIDAKGENEIKEYIKQHYDWFDSIL